MATNTGVCSICDLRYLTNPSTDWCPVCEEALCSDCKEHHSLSKATRDHKVIPIADYQKLPQNILDINQYCEDHGDKFQMLCQKHDQPICSRCIESHATCGEIVLLDNIIANVKKSTSFEDMIQILTDLEDNIKRIQHDRERNILSIEDQKKKCQDQIQTVRQKINQHLDKLEKQLITEISNAEDEAVQMVKSLLSVIKEKGKDIEKSKTLVNNMKQYASDLQTFLCIRDTQSALLKEEGYLQSLVDDGSLDQINISCSIDTVLQDFATQVQAFGSVQLQTMPTAVTLLNRQDKQAQVMVETANKSIHDINDIKANLLQKINLSGHANSVMGCCITPRDELLFTCREKCALIAINLDGSFNFLAPVEPRSAFNVTCIDETAVAVTSSEHTTGLTIVNLTVKRKTSVIDLRGFAYGITNADDSIITCIGGQGIQILNRKDVKLSTFVKSDIDAFSYIAEYNNNLYYTCPYKHTITCCDIRGQIKWTYNNQRILNHPRGIAIDNDGNVYVVGRASKNVVVISPDGAQEQLLTQIDGIIEPTGLFFDRSKKRLLVTNRQKTAYLFSVS